MAPGLWKLDERSPSKWGPQPASKRTHAIWVLLAFLATGSATGPARAAPRVRLAIVEHHWSGWTGGPASDTSIVEVGIGDSLGRVTGLCDRRKPFVLVGVLRGGDALVRYPDCLSFVRDSTTGGGPIGPETLVVRSSWAHLSTNTKDAGCDYALRLVTRGRSDARASGLWHDRYSADFPALGDHVPLDTRPGVVQRTQPDCPDPHTETLESRQMNRYAYMWVLVSKDGTLLATRSFERDSLVAASADDCVRRWTYRPGTYQGKPVAAWLGVSLQVCPAFTRVRH